MENWRKLSQNYHWILLLNKSSSNRLMGCIKQKSSFEHVQNTEIQINLHICKVSSGPLLSIHTFCCSRWFCQWTVKLLIRIWGCTGWSEWAISVHICLETHFRMAPPILWMFWILKRYKILISKPKTKKNPEDCFCRKWLSLRKGGS